MQRRPYPFKIIPSFGYWNICRKYFVIKIVPKGVWPNPLQWRHNRCDEVSNHQPHDCLLKRLCGGRSKKTSKLRVTGICAGNSPTPVNSPHKWPVARKMFPFDDVVTQKISLPNESQHGKEPIESCTYCQPRKTFHRSFRKISKRLEARKLFLESPNCFKIWQPITIWKGAIICVSNHQAPNFILLSANPIRMKSTF